MRVSVPTKPLAVVAGAFALGLGCLILSPEAQAETLGFKLPSGNIYCQYYDTATAGRRLDMELRCDIRSAASEHRPRRPDCQLDWGDAFVIKPKDRRGSPICHGDSIWSDDLPVLPYGAVWTRTGVECKAERSGLICINAARHGFRLSRDLQEVF